MTPQSVRAETATSNAAYPSEVRLRFATLPGRLLDRPSKRRALGKVGRPRGKLARYYERLSIQPCASLKRRTCRELRLSSYTAFLPPGCAIRRLWTLPIRCVEGPLHK